MKIQIFSKEEIFNYSPITNNKNCILIKIFWKHDYPLFYESEFLDILKLNVFDYRYYNKKEFKDKIISNNDIKKIEDFIKEHNNFPKRNLCILCVGGKSRSSSIAIGISKYILKDGQHLEIIKNPKYNPNPHFLRKFDDYYNSNKW